MSNKRIDPTSGQFIDPLFAVIIAAALAETMLPWAKRDDFPALIEVSTVVLGFGNLLLSWFGYHKSVYRKPIKGSLRFIVTVILLPAYLLTIVMYDRGLLFLTSAYFIVFLLWHFWEWIKYLEYDVPGFGFILGFFQPYNILAALPMIVALLLHFEIWQSGVPEGQVIHWICLALIALAIIWLRVSKSLKRGDGAIVGVVQSIRFALLGPRNGEQKNGEDGPETSDH